ncbi:lipoprotein-releasing ABC transporter permease subunit [Alteromonas sp. ASW11-36]|uniref:Lipoprotein-releasing ABC transporter permease subunit n=1 Tax=Alteromonas arenosi TaxID=3055817 RepID=A0ABT7SYG1_9ALTE|nr:lipoprotein-releasing ABC transporter permease subunit [Alteromonas sp. ASW11-36]MDM7861049.1 lipoprotein-releasing ABC transporter permease subunit [Alteromonas sp. ASW11-36]
MSLVWQLATRFRRAKQANGFVSFISASSTFGIGLGCFVLILLLSVMNGFQRELEQRLLAFIPHGELYAVSSQGIENWPQAIERFSQHNSVEKVQPYAKLTGMLQKARQMKAVELTALEPDIASSDALFDYIDDEVKQRYTTDKDAVILGKSIAEQLKLEVGDTVQLLIPTVTDDLTFVAPQTIWLTYVGSFSLGGELDNRVGFMPLKTAVEKLNISHGAQGLRFQLSTPFQARQVMRELGYSFEQAVYISDWTRTQGHLYQDIQLVRLIVYIALVLVIAVACFNIVSGLVMTVAEKKSSIGILMTMGLSANKVRMTFMLQGLLNGCIGVAVGTAVGVITALNLTDWITSIERLLGVSLLSGDIYFVNFLPTELHWQDVMITAVIALILSLISTLYPANKAAKLSPAKALS